MRMTLANILFVLVIVSALRDARHAVRRPRQHEPQPDGSIEGSRRSNRLMWWRVRLQLLTSS